ncbi:MAG: hypothetical protein R2729_01025 [Bryobacteraceae bacterium]
MRLVGSIFLFASATLLASAQAAPLTASPDTIHSASAPAPGAPRLEAPRAKAAQLAAAIVPQPVAAATVPVLSRRQPRSAIRTRSGVSLRRRARAPPSLLSR